MGQERTIRPMQAYDLDQLVQIWLAANLQAHPFIPATAWEGHLADLRAALPQAEVFVCERGGRIDGFIGLQDSYIAGLFVAPEAQSQGVGGALLARCQALHSRLFLDVFAENPRARRFYERHGFTAGNPGPSAFPPHLEYRMEWEKRNF